MYLGLSVCFKCYYFLVSTITLESWTSCGSVTMGSLTNWPLLASPLSGGYSLIPLYRKEYHGPLKDVGTC